MGVDETAKAGKKPQYPFNHHFLFMKNPPVLRHIVNLWTLWDYPTAKKPWSLERQLVAIKEAGFDGFTGNLRPGFRELSEKLGLIYAGYFSSSKPSEFRSLIQANIDAGAKNINVQLADHDTPVEVATKMAIKVMEEGEKLGIRCSIEVHRDTCTETPEKAYGIAAGFKKATGRLLPMTWDFSHISVVKHLAPPFSERLLVDAKLVQHAEIIHFRPFNGHHCQVPVTDGHGKLSAEVKDWIPFMEDTLALWLKGKQAGRELFVVPEMGPVRGGYNLAQLPNSWEDAKVLHPIIAKAWKKAVAAQK
jgi:hypothetical protein